MTCCNKSEHEVMRQEAVEAVTLERNPNAFRQKIASDFCIPHDQMVLTVLTSIYC